MELYLVEGGGEGTKDEVGVRKQSGKGGELRNLLKKGGRHPKKNKRMKEEDKEIRLLERIRKSFLGGQA